MEHVLSERTLNEYAYKDSTLDLLFIVDTRKREVIPFSKSLHHSMAAARYLGIPENDLSTETAGHIIGGFMELTAAEGKYDVEAYIGHSSMSTEKGIRYTQTTISEARKIVDDYLYRSPLVRNRSIVQSIRAA